MVCRHWVTVRVHARDNSRANGRLLTVAILVLHTGSMKFVSGRGHLTGRRSRQPLTKRENASLNSETCSSVRESAYGGGKVVISLAARDSGREQYPSGGRWKWPARGGGRRAKTVRGGAAKTRG